MEEEDHLHKTSSDACTLNDYQLKPSSPPTKTVFNAICHKIILF